MVVQENISGGRLADVLSVVLPNGSVLLAVNLIQVNHLVQLAAGLATLGYAVWRWRRDSYVICQGCRDGRPPAVCPVKPGKRPSWCPKDYERRLDEMEQSGGAEEKIIT